jgi:hypothetical protein
VKLGTQTGSVINHLHARATIGQPTPVVGMGATILLWTDRCAGTIIEVKELATSTRWQHEIRVQRDRSKVVAGSGHDGSAVYSFEPNPNGPVEIFRSRRDGGQWVACRTNDKGNVVVQNSGHGLRIGEREEYRDPSF